MSKRLLVLAGPDEGRVFPISSTDSLLVGRSRATDACLIDPHVARVHCQVQVEGDQVVISDFDSPGGTWVNGKRISKHILKAGDLLRLGNTRLQFLDDEAEAAWLAEPVPPAAAQRLTRLRPATARVTKLAASVSFPHGLVGQKLAHYKIGAVLARSKRGYVFHARDVRQNLPIALKVLEPAFAQDAKAVQRFIGAMKRVLPLRHPNLVTVYAAGKSSGYCWIAMEYVPGESLAATIGRIETPGQLPWQHVAQFAIHLVRGLAYAHERNVFHRNMTPHNILVGSRPDQAKLVDLMVAEALAGEQVQGLALRGDLVGDISFLAPECTAAGLPVDGRADVFSLGANLYAMLTGRSPFTGETATEIVQKVRREEPPRLRALYPALPERFDAIVHKMLAKRPGERYPDAPAVLADLEKISA